MHFIFIIIIEGFFMIKLIITIILLTSTLAVKREDLVTNVPGYGDHFQTHVYAGYLNTSDPSRRLHYVFVQSIHGANNSDPLTLWLNGGPGCSSLLGFLQQIGPFYLEDGKNYTKGDLLVENPYSWHNLSNLLFLEAPAGVGYSINSNSSYYEYNDVNTMNDNFDALRYFFTFNNPQYKKNPFWIAGQSYAGKYIPDLAVRIDFWNESPSTPEDQKINMQGIFVGNGIMSFRNGQLQKSQIEYMINHDFIDPQIMKYWNNACQVDPESAGCRYFETKFDENTDEVNPYNVYGYCFYEQQAQEEGKKKYLTQESIILSLALSSSEVSELETSFTIDEDKFNGAPCAYFDGMSQYFNAHVDDYHATAGMTWNGPCAQNVAKHYSIDFSGSMYQYLHLLTRTEHLSIYLYNGDWDSVVPFGDTIKNIQGLKLSQSKPYTPIFLDDQHIGFNQYYDGIHFMLVKGASHQVPQSQRASAYHIFESVVGGQSSRLRFE